jgi:hypothetical protein
MRGVVLLLIISNSIFGKASTPVDTFKTWDLNNKLKYTDFLDSNSCVNGDLNGIGLTQYVLETKIIQNNSNFFKLQYFILFNRYKSHLCIEDETLINHEQIHFDIGEKYLLLLNKKLSSLIKIKVINKKNYKTKIKYEYDYYTKLCYDEQLRYDTETDHGTDYENQIKWMKEINFDIKKNIRFKDIVIAIEK